jgi:hypothetical protein
MLAPPSPPIAENAATAINPMDDVLYCLMWIAARRLAAVPLAVEEVNRPVDFIATHTGISAEVIRMVTEFLDCIARDDY